MDYTLVRGAIITILATGSIVFIAFIIIGIILLIRKYSRTIIVNSTRFLDTQLRIPENTTVSITRAPFFRMVKTKVTSGVVEFNTIPNVADTLFENVLQKTDSAKPKSLSIQLGEDIQFDYAMFQRFRKFFPSSPQIVFTEKSFDSIYWAQVQAKQTLLGLYEYSADIPEAEYLRSRFSLDDILRLPDPPRQDTHDFYCRNTRHQEYVLFSPEYLEIHKT